MSAEVNTMADNKNLRDELFPDGMPEPEEFIRVIGAYIRSELANRASQKVPTDAELQP